MNGRAPARLVALVLLTSVVACSDDRHSPPPQQAALGGEAAARVGTDVIPLSLVARVAVDQRITPAARVRVASTTKRGRRGR